MGRKILIALAMAGGLIASSASADTKAGISAWAAGNYFEAVTQWQGPADSGDAEAQYWLGQAYRLGKGTIQNLAVAEEYYAKAAAQGNLAAADNYGLLLFNRGEKDRSIPYLRSAADRGDARAQYMLGLAHFNADGIERDWPRAYALLSLANKQGLEQATAALQQIDQHISEDQRAQGLALAETMKSQIWVSTTGEPDAPAPVRAPALAANASVTGSARATKSEKVMPAKAVSAKKEKPSKPKSAVATTTLAKAVSVAATGTKKLPKKASASGPWRIQLGAFLDRSNADALWSRAKNRSELSGHDRINEVFGDVTRLQAGGFASRAAAKAACSQLKSAGFDCLVISS